MANPHNFWQFPLAHVNNGQAYGGYLCIKMDDISRWANIRDGAITAIVNPTNEEMLAGGVVYEAIHNAAGPGLRGKCIAIPEVQPGIRCPKGEARLTEGCNLRVPYVIHTVGPVYGSEADPREALRKTYRSCLALARRHDIKCIAFPALSCGSSGFPAAEAAEIALSACLEFRNYFTWIYFIFNSETLYDAWMERGKLIF